MAVPIARAGGDEPGIVLVSGADFYSDPIVWPDGSTTRVAAVASPEHAVGRDRAVDAPIEADGALGLRRRGRGRRGRIDLPARVVA